jgi:threonyl-tRNA synthetase
MLTIHVDSFSSTITEKSRSKIVENPEPKTISVNEALLVLASVEKKDEYEKGNISRKAAEEIANLANQLKVKTIVLHSFAHLFAELSKPEAAIEILEMVKKELIQRKFEVIRTPFGWFNTLEIKAKGHPLSRVARIV